MINFRTNIKDLEPHTNNRKLKSVSTRLKYMALKFKFWNSDI